MLGNDHLSLIKKPGRYLGMEHNSSRKSWDSASVRWALIFPDLYEIGMSHQGLQILYHILNSQQQTLADRCYCPDLDMEKLLFNQKKSLCSLESGTPLSDFSILGITLPYELCYTNIVTILKCADIPLYARDRDTEYPLIIGGGSCSLNPEPVADFFDAILLGDGEEAVLEITEAVRKAKEDKADRKTQLEQLAEIDGVYVPSFFSPSYDANGCFNAIAPVAGKKLVIQRRIVADIGATEHLKHPLVPNAKIVHDRLGVEIARGCTRGCRFCQAGMLYRPVRERSPEQIIDLAETAIKNSGFEEMALLSLSTGDYSCLEQIVPQLMDKMADNRVSLALPSLRVGSLTHSVMNQIKRVRKTGFTLAPEAGSDRMRRVINKGITEEDLLTTCGHAFDLGWNVIKLYFMIGLPEETVEDVEAIVELAKKVRLIGLEHGRPGRLKINVSVGTFIPKPHTPFQWERQISIDESTEHINLLKRILPRKQCNLKWHNPKQSFLEGVFSRGDRQLAQVVETAWNAGARLDGWAEHFHLNTWLEASNKCQVDMEQYLAQRDPESSLPWQHLASGVDLQFLKDEMDNARSESYTPDCRYHSCQKCGVCDFKTIQPVVIQREQKTDKVEDLPDSPPVTAPEQSTKPSEQHFKYMVSYSRTGAIIQLGHLELLQVVFRSLRRAGIRTNFSQGFNPSPKISFSPALPVGTESMAEFFIMDLPALLANCTATTALLSKSTPPGITITTIALHSGKMPQNMAVNYTITLKNPLTEIDLKKLNTFNNITELKISRIRKGKVREIDIKPLVQTIKPLNDLTLDLILINRSGQPGVKPADALGHIFGWSIQTTSGLHIMKTAWTALVES